MPYPARSRTTAYFSPGYFPPGVKWLLIVNIAIFLFYFLAVRFDFDLIFQHFALVPGAVIYLGAFWQLFTYMFLHDPYGFAHILFNMLTLWMFGVDLERDWGTRRFLRYYFLCGIGAGVCVVVANWIAGSLGARTIGSSGAIYGLLLAFGMLYPDRMVLFSFLFPIKAKYFVMILGAIDFLSSIGASKGGVSHVAHLGGLLVGYIYLRHGRYSLDPVAGLIRAYEAYKFRSAKRRFQRYMHKHRGPNGPVN
ncbi:MAG: rhomboid family intramembrane serine protease [Acidobacteriales bacterium]|nr:rhomboid family intramembrane serine protease [Terriglobales bacterium]